MDARANPYGGLGDAFRQSLGAKGAGLGDFFGGIFNNPRDPWRHAQRDYDFYANQAGNQMNPFIQAGQGALGRMSNPQDYINQLMGGYQESPYAKYLQDQAKKAGINAASAEGTIGSTPFAQQMAQNAAGISSADMQNWLANILGIDKDLLQTGYGAATNEANILGQRAADEARFGFNKDVAGQGRLGSIFGGLWNTFFG